MFIMQNLEQIKYHQKRQY